MFTLTELPLFVGFSDDSDGDSSPSCALGHLPPHFEQPVVSESSVSSALLHLLDVFPDLRVETIRTHVDILPTFIVSSSVEEPNRHSMARWVGDDFGYLFPNFIVNASRSCIQVNFCQLADQMRKSRSDSFDRAQRVGDSSTAVKVGVHHTNDVFEFVFFVVN